MKKSIFFLSLILCFFVSCSTTEKVLSFQGKDGGQLYFLRPFNISLSSNEIKKISLDLTVNVSDGKIANNPVLNFSAFIPKTSNLNPDEISLCLVSSAEKADLISKTLLNRTLKDNLLEVRYTSELDKNIFASLLKSGENLEIEVLFSGEKIDSIHSDEFNTRISDLRLLTW